MDTLNLNVEKRDHAKAIRSDQDRLVRSAPQVAKAFVGTKLSPIHTIKTTVMLILSLVLGMVVATATAGAQDREQSNVAVSAALYVGGEKGGENSFLIVNADIKKGLHIYAQSQPKPFLATRFELDHPAIKLMGPFQPERSPLRLRNEALDVELHEFEGQIRWKALVAIDGSKAADAGPIKLQVFAQACQADRCFAPETYSVDVAIAQQADQQVQTATPVQVRATQNNGHSGSNDQMLFSDLPKIDDHPETDAPPVAEATAWPDAGLAGWSNGTIKGQDGFAANSNEFSLDELKTQGQGEKTDALSIYAILPLAFIAGFILNFMPCVLPVVGLKVLSFVQQAENNRRRIFMLNLAYALGTISVLLVLATLATFAGLGWGEQFSSVTFTVVLASIVFAFALNFFGVWEIELPGFVGQVGENSKQEGLPGAFSKGILSTVLATPCSGPFLGSALAWALVQPVYITYLVFGTVGLGMASPFLVIGVFPKLVKWLPKPGVWMIGFKQLMGFVLIATVIFLLSFISIPALVPTLALLTAIGLACWFYGQHDGTQAQSSWKRMAGATAILVAAAYFSFGWLYGVSAERFERAAHRFVQSQTELTGQTTLANAGPKTEADEIPWQVYSKEALELAIASGKTVFVDFTADWCLTCKANESVAINKPEVADVIRNNEIIAFRADKTEPSPEVDKLLRQLGNQSASIPFYAVFPKNEPGAPLTLDGIFASPKPFVDALNSSSM